MILYKLAQSSLGEITITTACTETIPVHRLLPIDTTSFRSKYGMDVTSKEIDLFHAHYAIWNDFKNRKDDYCLILEEGGSLISQPNEIVSQISKITEEWDVFFPYDKVRNSSDRTSICLSHFGFFWGYHFYIINKAGVEKLLNFKAIQQPLDEQILSESLRKNLTIYAGRTNWYVFNETSSFAYQARSKSMRSFVDSYSVWDKEDKAKAVAMLLYIQQKAKDVDVKIGLHAGTLLGAIRHDKIMDWDDDVDLIISEGDVDKLLNAIRTDGVYNITNWIWKKTGELYYKIWQDGGKSTEGYEYSFPFIDIWTYKEQGEGILTNDGYSFEKNEFFPLELIKFESGNFYIPSNYKDVLNTMYKDWDKSIKIFSWSHQNKQHINTKMIVPIVTDDFGRFVNYC